MSVADGSVVASRLLQASIDNTIQMNLQHRYIQVDDSLNVYLHYRKAMSGNYSAYIMKVSFDTAKAPLQWAVNSLPTAVFEPKGIVLDDEYKSLYVDLI
jgi:hypothetical protein